MANGGKGGSSVSKTTYSNKKMMQAYDRKRNVCEDKKQR